MNDQIEYWNASKVSERVGVSHMTVWRWVKEGTFPKPRSLGPNRIAWLSSDVIDWMTSRPEAGGAA